MRLKLHVRHPDADVFIARLKAFGFTVHDKGAENIQIEREGRQSVVKFGETVECIEADPRDRWLLFFALEEERRWEACESYFLRRADGDFAAAHIMLGATPGPDRKLNIVHGPVGSAQERYNVGSFDELMDALPFLAPSNAVGYHRARSRVFARYEQLRPKTWEDVGLTDEGTISEYERHRVRPDDIANAAKSGIVGMDRIIATFGIPADDEWIDVRERRESDKTRDMN